MSTYEMQRHDSFRGEVVSVVETYPGWTATDFGVESSPEFKRASRLDFNIGTRAVRSMPDVYVSRNVNGQVVDSFFVETKKSGGPQRSDLLVEALPLVAHHGLGIEVLYVCDTQTKFGRHEIAATGKELIEATDCILVPNPVTRGGVEYERTSPEYAGQLGRVVAPDTQKEFAARFTGVFPESVTVTSCCVGPGCSGDPFAAIPGESLQKFPNWRDALRERLEGGRRANG